MKYRICKSFEVESGHMLSKHPGRCRFPHGHSRRVDLVLSSETLDDRDMVCDFKALKLAVGEYLDAFDHAMVMNAADASREAMETARIADRVIVFEGEDPTTEVMARRIFEHVAAVLGAADKGEPPVYRDAEGHAFTLRQGITLERVRVTETSSSWAEYGV